MSGTVPLNDGRIIHLRQLHQCLTYGGLLVGTPDADLNNHRIQDLMEQAQGHRPTWGQPYLIEPPRRTYQQQPGDIDDILTRTTHVPEWIPAIGCIGWFESYQVARDPQCDFSFLAIVWFQEGWAMPISPEILAAIQALDWNTLASDGQF